MNWHRNDRLRGTHWVLSWNSVRTKKLTDLGVWNRALRNRIRPISELDLPPRSTPRALINVLFSAKTYKKRLSKSQRKTSARSWAGPNATVHCAIMLVHSWGCKYHGEIQLLQHMTRKKVRQAWCARKAVPISTVHVVCTVGLIAILFKGIKFRGRFDSRDWFSSGRATKKQHPGPALSTALPQETRQLPKWRIELSP